MKQIVQLVVEIIRELEQVSGSFVASWMSMILS
jgi:hypothetical protein